MLMHLHCNYYLVPWFCHSICSQSVSGCTNMQHLCITWVCAVMGIFLRYACFAYVSFLSSILYIGSCLCASDISSAGSLHHDFSLACDVQLHRALPKCFITLSQLLAQGVYSRASLCCATPSISSPHVLSLPPPGLHLPLTTPTYISRLPLPLSPTPVTSADTFAGTGQQDQLQGLIGPIVEGKHRPALGLMQLDLLKPVSSVAVGPPLQIPRGSRQQDRLKVRPQQPCFLSRKTDQLDAQNNLAPDNSISVCAFMPDIFRVCLI